MYASVGSCFAVRVTPDEVARDELSVVRPELPRDRDTMEFALGTPVISFFTAEGAVNEVVLSGN
jgi:hypothetical protein